MQADNKSFENINAIDKNIEGREPEKESVRKNSMMKKQGAGTIGTTNVNHV